MNRSDDEKALVDSLIQALYDTVGPEDRPLVPPPSVPAYGWVTLYKPTTGEHTVPAGDTYPHYARDCACQPMVIDDCTIHNAFDERDKFESGLRKRS